MATKNNLKAVLKAIEGSGGVKATIADRLKVSRWTVDNYLERWATAQSAYEEEKGRIDDVALSVIIADIEENRDVSTAKWWVAKKIPEFSERLDVTSGGEKIIVRLTDD